MKKTVKDYIRTIADFPHDGIMFRDVTTLFADARGFRMAIDQLLHPYAGERIDKVVGLEARGFILGGAIAHQLSVGFVPIRKKGKLPGATIAQDYKLEYGEAIMEIHDDALKAGRNGAGCRRPAGHRRHLSGRDQAVRTAGRADHWLRLCHRPSGAWRAGFAGDDGHGCACLVRIRRGIGGCLARANTSVRISA